MTAFEKSFVMRIIRWAVIRAGLYGIAAWLCAREMRERLPDGTSVPASASSKKLTALALTAHKFRGDLNDLAAIPEVRLLEMPHVWQTRMLRTFYRGRITGTMLFRPETDPANAVRQKKYRAFLLKFLTILYRKFGVGCVIAADVRYREDIDIGSVSRQLGVPYLVFHRECMLASRVLYQTVLARHSQWGRFPGSAIIVYNEVSRQNFLESGFVEPERIEVLGSARMDGYLKTIQSQGRKPSARPLVVLFSFVHYQNARQYPKSVFEKAHIAVARVAERNPDVDVVVKPKREVFRKTPWPQMYSDALTGAGMDPQRLSNLTVEPDANAQELILRASVVCSINSTALLEAGIAGVPTVVPCFQEIQGEEFRDRINFRDELDVFDIASDVDDMIALIERHVRKGSVTDTELKARQALFERYVSPISGGAAERYRATIFRHVEAAGAPFRTIT